MTVALLRPPDRFQPTTSIVPLRVTTSEKKIISVLAALIVLGLIGMALL